MLSLYFAKDVGYWFFSVNYMFFWVIQMPYV